MLQQTSPSFIITASRDIWRGYKRMEVWSFECRNHRTNCPPIRDPALPPFDIVGLSDRLIGEFEKLPSTDSKDRTGRGQARLQVIEAYARYNIPPGFSHGKEKAVPMACPDFKKKGRCLRCQALFMYDVDDEVLLLEKEMRESNSSLGALAFDGWTCAETIARFYCIVATRRSFPSHRDQSSTT